jgi:Fic/DOC family protein
MRVRWTDHLVRLVGRAEAAGARLAAAPADARADLARVARRESARLNARLDASPLTDETADRVDSREERGLPLVDAAFAPTAQVSRGWAGALGLDDLATQEVAAIEYANLLACADVEPEVAPAVFEEPLAVLARLHDEVLRGLVDPDVVGRPRRTDQGVADGAQGALLYRGADPDAIPGLLIELATWLTETSASLPALVVAGGVQERLLQWQPFEAGNGRLARVASRVVLRARGLDPDAVAVPERAFLADRRGYFAEIAATIRRRGDLTLWLERYGEALAAALEAAADDLVLRPVPAPDPRVNLEPGETITLPEYAERAGVTRASAALDLERLVAAGVLELQPQSRGLSYRRAGVSEGTV